MANELSLVISNPNEKDFLQKIDWNKEDFMKLVASITERYTGVVYSEEQMKEAKDDRAKLNAMKKAISDRRIEVKNAIMAPYNQFEKEVKEVVALIDGPVALIDSQIKEYEERLKNEKHKNLVDYFEEQVADLEYELNFDMFFDIKWLNMSVSLKKAKEEIENKINRFKTDIRSIETLCDEQYRPQLKDYYIRCLDITKTMAECSRLREVDRKEKERKEREAEEVRLKEEQKAAIIKTEEIVTETAENVPMTPKTEQNSDEIINPFALQEDSKKYKASFTIYGTKEQIMAVKKYMTDNNIKFGKVEN